MIYFVPREHLICEGKYHGTDGLHFEKMLFAFSKATESKQVKQDGKSETSTYSECSL